MAAKQGALHQDPAFNLDEVERQINLVKAETTAIFNQPPPKPKEEPKKEEAPKEGEAPKEEEKPDAEMKEDKPE